jgi:lysophospholipase L1-like esterase
MAYAFCVKYQESSKNNPLDGGSKMPLALAADVRTPDALSNNIVPVFPQDDYDQSFLTQGDSWFSLNAVSSYNLLFGLRFSRSTLIINCACPGGAMRNMIQWRISDQFESLLGPDSSVRWSGILVSGGGNDMLNALPDLLLDFPTGVELQPGDVAQLINPNNFGVFEMYLRQNYADLIALRDASGSLNRDVPIFAHTYDYATPRNAKTALLGLPAFGPWLCASMLKKGIPQQLWIALSKALQDKLANIILTLNLPNLHVVDTRGVLTPARLGTTGQDGDWDNETHPSREGYNKLARRWDDLIESALQRHR